MVLTIDSETLSKVVGSEKSSGERIRKVFEENKRMKNHKNSVTTGKSIPSHLYRPYKHQDLNVKLNSKVVSDSNRSINWELNEKISLSSGSSAGIEIRPNLKSVIGFTDKHRTSSTTSTDDQSSELTKLHKSIMNKNKLMKPSDSKKQVLNLLNVSGFDEKNGENDSSNILKSDCKYEIGVPGECTISRKKRMDRRKVETLRYKKSGNVDLTGTVRRKWIPANEKIDDSIAKRLELIHELNQKILANYERIQAKSKKTNSKEKESYSKNSLKKMKEEKELARDNEIYSEVKSKKKREVKKIVEKAMVHRVDDESLDRNVCKQEIFENLDDRKVKMPSKVNDNFSLAVKSNVNVELDVKQSEKYDSSKLENEMDKLGDEGKTKGDEFDRKIKDIDSMKMKITRDKENLCVDDRFENSKVYPRISESDINFCKRNWKDEFYSAIKEDQRKDLIECKVVNKTLNDEKEVESTKTLEKEILDNLNETIQHFDCDKIDDDQNYDKINEIQVDEGHVEDSNIEENDDDFSEDSISPKSNKPFNKNQETFNSSWDSGVGIEVATGSGWVRIHTGIESSLVYLTLDTTAKDICRDMLLGDELSLYMQYGGEIGRRLEPDERPLEYQDNFLKQIGYDELSRRARLGVDPELRYLIAFHVGPSEPQADLMGYSRSGSALILKGLVFPQWKKRVLAVIGSRLFLYPASANSRAEWLELEGGAVCLAPSRLGQLVLRVTGYPRIHRRELQSNPEQFHQDGQLPGDHHHHETRHLYLGFHHPWDRDLWRGWLKHATQLSSGPKKLDLSKSGLSRIPESVLSFPATETIILNENRLDNPNSNLRILQRFPRLRAIELERNELKTIPQELVQLEALTFLDLSNNKIQQVPAEIYRLVNLKDFILDRNEIKNLPNELGRLKQLKSLSVADNHLNHLPTFLTMRALALEMLNKNDSNRFKDEKSNQNNLHKVNLRNNQLKGNIILGNYGNLTHLDVSENSIEKLDVSALQELQSARCARNSLTELTLCGRNLISLIAGHNKLKKLTIEPIPTNLEHLDVSYNCLDALPEWIPDLPVLRALFASHNDLTALPDRLLSQPSRLEVLHLPHNRLQALPPPRKPLNIVHLTLQGNALTALPLTFFQNTERMKVLNLSNNRLSELPYNDEASKNRSTSHTLEKLYLTGNCLTDAALDALAKLPALRILHLAYNILDTLPESCIASWPDLEELVLSGNRLQYLPDNVANLKHLRVLRVHSNRLLTCPTFNKTTSLMVLDLAHNQLDRVNLSTLVPPQLQFLDISCNSRLHVDPRQFQVYRSQRPVSLIDVSGQNRPSLPSHPLQQEIVSGEKGSEQPWRLGFSETAGTREKLYISQVRMPSFCNVEGLFGIFDGGTNQEAPGALQEMIPRLLLEERTIRETFKDYLKYTLLSAHRELKEKGQKYGIDATLIHITKVSNVQNYSRNVKKYCLKVASSGETKAVLCRASGPVILAPPKKTTIKNQLGNSGKFPLVIPDPTSEDIILEDDDEFIIIANRKLWEVLTIQEAVREARAEASPVLAAKRLQDLAQAYGAEDNLSIIVVRLSPGVGDLDQLMRELRHVVNKNRNQPENNCSCPCCIPPLPHKSPSACCCHANNNEGFYLNGVLKNIVNNKTGSSRSSGRYFKNSRTSENASPPFRDDRSSPSGQSDQTTDSTFKSRQSSGRGWVGSTASRVASKTRQNMIVQENLPRKEDVGPEKGAMSEEQFRCWEYMLEQNTHMLFDKELDTLNRLPLRRGQSRSTPQLANLPFLSKRFGSARSFNPPLPRAPMMRFGSGRRFLNGGPNAAYFGSLQRLMPYNLEYDFAVIQERGLDSLEQDASRLGRYWDVTTTEL